MCASTLYIADSLRHVLPLGDMQRIIYNYTIPSRYIIGYRDAVDGHSCSAHRWLEIIYKLAPV